MYNSVYLPERLGNADHRKQLQSLLHIILIGVLDDLLNFKVVAITLKRITGFTESVTAKMNTYTNMIVTRFVRKS